VLLIACTVSFSGFAKNALVKNSKPYPIKVFAEISAKKFNFMPKVWHIYFDFNSGGCSYHVNVLFDDHTGAAAGSLAQNCGHGTKTITFGASKLWHIKSILRPMWSR
jgi:hypothetical protein